jgi:hypothetical protein
MSINTVWAVRYAVRAIRYGTYDPYDIIALYDNEPAARQHANMVPRLLEIVPMEVRSTPPTRPEQATG